MLLLIQLNDEDEDGGAEDAGADDDDNDGDYLSSKVCQRCVMQRDQWGSHSAKAKPEGPKKTATQSHGFTVCVCVCVCVCEEKGEFNSVTHALHI